jgi:hypothetical protein
VIARLFALAAIVVPLIVPPAARAADDVPPPGTVLIGWLDHGLDSRTSDVLEPFTVTGVVSDDQAFRGGRIFGHVTKVVKASKNARGEVDVAFDAYISRAGRRFPMQGSLIDVRVPVKPTAPPGPTDALPGKRDASPGKPDASPVPLGIAGPAVMATKPRTDVTIPAHTMFAMQVAATIP